MNEEIITANALHSKIHTSKPLHVTEFSIFSGWWSAGVVMRSFIKKKKMIEKSKNEK